MKKKNIILDFTSLLDIIMILLFVVLLNTQQNAANEIEKSESTIQQLSIENDVLKKETEAIELDSANHVEVYGSVIDKMTKINLICTTSVDTETGASIVNIDVVVNTQEDSISTAKETFVIPHELDLSSGERKILIANQTTDFSELLYNILEIDDSPLYWFMVQYDYNNVDFTYSDLNIIYDSIDNVELSLSKECYIEEINIK